MITAEELFVKKFGSNTLPNNITIRISKNSIYNVMQEYGKLCAEEALRMAADNVIYTSDSEDAKQSILNTKLDFIQ